MENKIVPDSIVYSNTFSVCNVLDVSDFKDYYRINHSEGCYRRGDMHINGIENFWNQAKRRLCKFNGVPEEHFALFLKQCEWRFNNPAPKDQLKQLEQWVRHYMK